MLRLEVIRVNIVYRFLTVLALLLAQNAYALDLNAQPASREVSGALEIPCPSSDFSIFIRTFSNDVNVQKTFTKYPLKKQFLDPDAEPEPKKVIRNLKRHQIQFPIIPLHEERVKQSLEIHIASVTANTATVTLVKPDTDYQVSYYFRKSGCWGLVRIEDWSL